ncbi:ATP-binding protein [Candidatus Riflebacteria bacterium]
MSLNELHAQILGEAFGSILGNAEIGSMAYIRCLPNEELKTLVSFPSFAPEGWKTWLVTNEKDIQKRKITADQAVEMREKKGTPTLLIVNTDKAGAGMDGIYSAAREITEKILFKKAISLAKKKVPKKFRVFAGEAVKKARNRERGFSISFWTEFNFLVKSALDGGDPGAYVYLLGLWPIKKEEKGEPKEWLKNSQIFVNRLLGTTASTITIKQRIDSLRFIPPTTEVQIDELETFIRKSISKPLTVALEEISEKQNLWVNELKIEGSPYEIQELELLSWRYKKTGKLNKWSGLTIKSPEEPPYLYLDPNVEKNGNYSKLEVRWRVQPTDLKKGAVDYQVVVKTEMDDELASRDIPHLEKKEQKCAFTNDDFSDLSEDAFFSAKVVLSVINNTKVTEEESEEFLISTSENPGKVQSSVGKRYRCFSECVIELNDREEVKKIAESNTPLAKHSKGDLILRTFFKGKSYRVYQPPLIEELEKKLFMQGALGRWRVRIRLTGEKASELEFLPFDIKNKNTVERVTKATRRFSELLKKNQGGAIGQVYDEKASHFDTIKEYLNAWNNFIDDGHTHFTLTNTIEVQTLSGKTLGLLVLPSHPLRVAWHVAYDNLILFARFNNKNSLLPPRIRQELAGLDGSMFPPFLPGIEKGSSFIFADTIGFHAVAMVLDSDPEPKAAVAQMAKVLGDKQLINTAPTVGNQTAQILGNEIRKYIEFHNNPRFLHIHALRPGDGMTISRALGVARNQNKQDINVDHEKDNEIEKKDTAFLLQIFPSKIQKGIAGRFIAEVSEKRRSGAGTLAEEDRWLLETINLKGGVAIPCLRWARREEQIPNSAAHLAATFDIFDSQVEFSKEVAQIKKRPLNAFGLTSFFERRYKRNPFPSWINFVSPSWEGEKHPSDRSHTDRLLKLQQTISSAVSRSLGGEKKDIVILKTEIPDEKEEALERLHSLCDWVITIDRIGGVEYFDDPKENPDIFDAFVIDCVPEREDLGSLQLVTTTTSLEEVRNLLDQALEQMGLSRSLDNAKFLLKNLKALSGRLAIRLTSKGTTAGELIALALTQAKCCSVESKTTNFLSLENGFFVPIDDIKDLLPVFSIDGKKERMESVRPDLIHVSVESKSGLIFRFVEVKYRQYLRTSRNPRDLQHILKQTKSMRTRWNSYYFDKSLPPYLSSLRRSKLARILRFYAEKAKRHYLGEIEYKRIVSEIDKFLISGIDDTQTNIPQLDRGFIFCPEFSGNLPLEISSKGCETKIFVFGPGHLPHSGFRRERKNIEIDTNSKKHKKSGTLNSETSPDTIKDISKTIETIPGDDSELIPKDKSKEAKTSSNGCQITLGLDKFYNNDVQWRISTKGNPHLMIVGLPGMGKTTCLINICRQMWKKKIQPIVFSYHEDIDERFKNLYEKIRFIDLEGLGFNPLTVFDRQSPKAYLDIVSDIRDIFEAIFPDIGPLQSDHIRRALKDSYLELGWGDSSADYESLKVPEFKRFYEILCDSSKPNHGLRTLLARLNELEDYNFFEVGDSCESLWESEYPTVIRIHSTQNPILQRAFSSLVFYSFYKGMFRRGIQSNITHAIIFDEAHRASRLKLIPTMAKECRKYGITLVLASQEAKDFRDSVYSAIGNYLVLRVTETDAKALVRNVSSSEQERIKIDRLKQLERFKALYFLEGHEPSEVELSK